MMRLLRFLTYPSVLSATYGIQVNTDVPIGDKLAMILDESQLQSPLELGALFQSISPTYQPCLNGLSGPAKLTTAAWAKVF